MHEIKIHSMFKGSKVFLHHSFVKYVTFRFNSMAIITHLCSSTISLLRESSSLMAEKSATRLAVLF